MIKRFNRENYKVHSFSSEAIHESLDNEGVIDIELTEDNSIVVVYQCGKVNQVFNYDYIEWQPK